MKKVTQSNSLVAFKALRVGLGKFANMIKNILPPPFDKSWGLKSLYITIFPKVDKHTCMAPRHIEPTKGRPGAWKNVLSEYEKMKISSRYQSNMFAEDSYFTNDNSIEEKKRESNDK